MNLGYSVRSSGSFFESGRCLFGGLKMGFESPRPDLCLASRVKDDPLFLINIPEALFSTV